MDGDFKYKDALDRARMLYDGEDNNKYDSLKDVLERIFPELAESEDEKIRMWLIEQIKIGIKSAPRIVDTANAEKAVSWLEKQKSKEWSNEDAVKHRAICDWLVSNNNSVFNGFRAFELLDWLKSLSPWTRWKPSECQLEDLRKTITGYENDHRYSGALPSLYNDLKKL